jgi:hypothetical protein
MKTFFTCLFVIGALASFSQPKGMEMGLSFIGSAPQGSMRENMTVAGGLSMDFYFTPATNRYALGLEMSVNGYGYDKTRQTYNFSDGSSAPMDIIVNNNFFNFMLAGRHFLSQGKVRPYINAKAGYSVYSTSLNIYDPDEFDHCEPVDSDVLKRDGAIIFSAGGGVRWEMLPKKNPGRFFLNLSANYTSGGKVDYMNADAPKHSHTNHTSDVYMEFLNTQTQVVHEHHVGNVYTSLVELIDFRFGVTMRFNPTGD